MGLTGSPSCSGTMALNQVRAGTLPPKMLPLPHSRGGSVSQIGAGLDPSGQTSTAPEYCGVAPMNPAERLAVVVPVLPSIGRVQFAAFAAAKAVPPGWSSLLNPTAREFARPSGTTCSQGA